MCVDEIISSSTLCTHFLSDFDNTPVSDSGLTLVSQKNLRRRSGFILFDLRGLYPAVVSELTNSLICKVVIAELILETIRIASTIVIDEYFIITHVRS